MSDDIDLGIPGIGPATLVGHGGFGLVYRATQLGSGGLVAVKVLQDHLDESASLRFQREARALGTLRGHPNICTVYDAGVDPRGRPYLIMEYAPSSLAQRIADEGALPWAEAADLGVRLASALEAAHQAGLLHRDVKPENVLRTAFDEWRLADFGLVRQTDDTLSRSLTATVTHAAPELLEGAPASVASDVYALGSTLFVALTGKPAFAAGDQSHPVSIYRRIAEDPVPDMPGIPSAIVDVVRTAMAKDPADRFPTAAAMSAALQRAQQVAAATAPPVPPGEVGPRTGPYEGAGGDDTNDVRTPNRPEDLTQAVPRGGRPPPPTDEAQAPPEPAPGRSRQLRTTAIAVAAVLVVAVIGGMLVALSGNGDGDDDDRGSEETTTTAEPLTPAERIEGDWSLDTAKFLESSFCDVDTCLALDTLELTISCDSSGENCHIDVAGEGDGRVTEGEDASGYEWHALLPDVLGFAQLRCGEDPAPSNLVLEFDAHGEQPSDGSATSLVGIYRSELTEQAPCGPAYVTYTIELRR